MEPTASPENKDKTGSIICGIVCCGIICIVFVIIVIVSIVAITDKDKAIASTQESADCGWKDGYGCDGQILSQSYDVDKFECYEQCELTSHCSCVTWEKSASPVCSVQEGSPEESLSVVEAYEYSDTCRDEEDATTKCPGSFNYCAVQGGDCLIPDNIETGYISYGVDGRWVFFGFSNQWGTYDEAGYESIISN